MYSVDKAGHKAIDRRKCIPSLASLRAFEAFGRLGSIRKAGDALDIEHAVVGRHLRSLEVLLGISLIDRSERSFWLTKEGRIYHKRISFALSQISMATESLLNKDEKHLCIWCVHGFAYHWLNRRLKYFREISSVTDIRLRPTDFGPNFLVNEADGDIRYFQPGHENYLSPAVRSCEISQPELYPVASPQLAMQISASIEDASSLMRAPLLHEEDHEEWRAWFAGQGMQLSGSLPGPRLWQAHLAINAAIDGQGIALASDLLAEGDILSGRLVRLRPRTGSFRPVKYGSYRFVAREDRWNSHVISQFRTWLCQLANQDRQ